jgi:hypothetical protein
MMMCARVVRSAARPILAGVVVSMFTAGSAWAQDARSAGPLTLTAAVTAAAVDTTASSATTADPQAPAATPDPQAPAAAPATPPAPTPAEIAAKQDAATLDFFRRTEISGFVDAYYSYNFNKPSKACATVGGVAVFNCLYNFNVAHNSFSLNLAELAFEKKPTADSRGGFRVDLDYGPTAAIVNQFEPTSVLQNVEQGYVSFLADVGSGLQLDFGKFVTPMGNEVIESKDNWNYSRGLLFSLAIPYYHVGLRAAYTVNDQVSLTGFLVNGWNDAVDNNTGKTGGVSLALKPNSDLAVTVNYLGGPEQANDNSDMRNMLDVVATYTVNKMVSLAGNYDYGQDTVAGSKVSWQGVAGYLRLQPVDWFALSPRAEYYNDANGFTTGVTQKVTEVTVTAEFKHKDGVIFRLEYRGDVSNAPYFVNNTGALVKNQSTFTAGMIYAFSTKAQ